MWDTLRFPRSSMRRRCIEQRGARKSRQERRDGRRQTDARDGRADVIPETPALPYLRGYARTAHQQRGDGQIKVCKAMLKPTQRLWLTAATEGVTDERTGRARGGKFRQAPQPAPHAAFRAALEQH